MVVLPESAYESLIEVFAIDKAEDDKLIREESSHTFIETTVYKKIKKDGKFLIIGRKGSGKTGLILGYNSRKYNEKKHIRNEYISFDNFPFAATIAFFAGNFDKSIRDLNLSSIKQDEIRGELKDLIGPAFVFKYAWTNCILYFCTYIAVDYLLEEDSLSGRDKSDLVSCKLMMEKKFPFLKQKSTNNNGMFYGFLLELLGVLVNSLVETIKQHNSDNQSSISDEASLIAEIISQGINIANEDLRVSESSFARAAAVIKKELKTKDKTILVTLDKFDDFLFDIYTKFSKDSVAIYIERRQLFMSVMEGLILAIRDIKREDDFSWIGTLLTIPKDKYVDLELRESSQLEHTHTVNLDWSASELFKLVEARFSYIMDEYKVKWHDLLGDHIQNGRVQAVKEDLFLYVLRHSLWRPREILRYFTEIFRILRDAEREPDIGEVVRYAIKKAQGDIIENEVIKEFIEEFPSLRKALRQIETREFKAVLPYKEFIQRLSRIKLAPHITRSTEVALRLYHIGVVGVRKNLRIERHGRNGSITQNQSEIAYEFIYNSNEINPFVDEGVVVCFHPLFFEYLNVTTPDSYVVNQLEWNMFRHPNLHLPDE